MSGVICSANMHSVFGRPWTCLQNQPLTNTTFSNFLGNNKKSHDGFIAYKTSHYKLHYYETLTGLKFVLNSDPGVESLQSALRQIYTQIYVELVVKNPLASTNQSSGMPINPETMGVEGFRNGVDRFVRSLTMFDTL